MGHPCDEMKVVYNPDTNCKLLSTMIEYGLCYDIQMVRHRGIKEDALKFKLDIDKANELCSTCEFNPLPPMTREEIIRGIIEDFK